MDVAQNLEQSTWEEGSTMSAILRPSDRPLFRDPPRNQLRVYHVALIALLGWGGYLLLSQTGLF